MDPAESGARTWVPLSARERRVAGVLVEKQKTTPEYYPMTLAAITTGCNQKSNRDPLTSYESDHVEETLQTLRKKGAAVVVEGSGRVVKFKHNLYEWLGLRNRPDEMAILAELLLRGAQTEGELRARASRMMDNAPDLATLQRLLDELARRELIVYLTPPGQKRGVVVTHGLYPPEELERVKQAHAQRMAADEANEGAPAPASRSGELESLRNQVAGLVGQVEELQGAVALLRAELSELKSSLGS